MLVISKHLILNIYICMYVCIYNSCFDIALHYTARRWRLHSELEISVVNHVFRKRYRHNEESIPDSSKPNLFTHLYSLPIINFDLLLITLFNELPKLEVNIMWYFILALNNMNDHIVCFTKAQSLCCTKWQPIFFFIILLSQIYKPLVIWTSSYNKKW